MTNYKNKSNKLEKLAMSVFFRGNFNCFRRIFGKCPNGTNGQC